MDSDTHTHTYSSHLTTLSGRWRYTFLAAGCNTGSSFDTGHFLGRDIVRPIAVQLAINDSDTIDYYCAIRHMTEPDHIEESDQWHFGLFLHQQYLQQQTDHLLNTLLAIKQRH